MNQRAYTVLIGAFVVALAFNTAQGAGAGVSSTAGQSWAPQRGFLALDSIRPQDGDTQDSDAQIYFDKLIIAIKQLPGYQQSTASRTLIQAVHDVGPQIFDDYLSTGFFNTWTKKKEGARQIAFWLGIGDIKAFKQKVLGSGPFDP
jgi:predicted small secreted protein